MAKVKIKLDGSRKQIAEFKKRALPALAGILKVQVKESILRGVSPVQGKGRFKQYSRSYRDAIKGKATFWKSKKGKTIALHVDDFRIDDPDDRRALKDFIKRKNADLMRLKNNRVSPVNMKLTGEMLKNLKVTPTGRSVSVKISHPLADIHNRRGAGKTKVVRRLLPTRRGERFNRTITNNLREALRKIANQIFTRRRGG